MQPLMLIIKVCLLITMSLLVLIHYASDTWYTLSFLLNYFILFYFILFYFFFFEKEGLIYLMNRVYCGDGGSPCYIYIYIYMGET